MTTAPRERSTRKVIGQLFLLVFLKYLISLAAGIVLTLLGWKDSDLWYAGEILVAVVSVIALYWFYKAFLDKNFREPFFKVDGVLSWRSLPEVLAALCVALFFSYAAAFLVQGLRWIGFSPADYGMEYPGEPAIFALYVLYVVLIAPILEELFFRGFLFRIMERAGLSKRDTVFLSALLFGMLHAGLRGMIGAFLSGLLLGLLAMSRGGLLLAIFLHIANNTLAYVAFAAGQNEGPFAALFALAVILCAICGAVIFASGKKHWKLLDDGTEKTKIKFRDMVSVWSILCLVLLVFFLGG